jgi:hypothetical protein
MGVHMFIPQITGPDRSFWPYKHRGRAYPISVWDLFASRNTWRTEASEELDSGPLDDISPRLNLTGTAIFAAQLIHARYARPCSSCNLQPVFDIVDVLEENAMGAWFHISRSTGDGSFQEKILAGLEAGYPLQCLALEYAS